MSQLKQQLYNLCNEYLSHRMASIQKKIQEAQEAANNEEKSSAGDKYETGREMMQQEVNMNLTQLNETRKMKLVLDQINPFGKSNTAMAGSIVYTDQGNYYIAISAGKLVVDNVIYVAISAAAPIGAKFIGQERGAVIVLNGKKFAIENLE